jgi:hypothetical protein
LPVAAALLLAQLSIEGMGRFLKRIAEFNPYLAGVPYPPPLPDKRPAAEKMGLYIEDVVTVLVSLRIALL